MQKPNLSFVLLVVCVIALPLSQSTAGEPGAQIYGGVSMGLPSGFNINAGIAANQIGANLAGLFIGDKYPNSPLLNGAQLDLYKPFTKDGSLKHRLSLITGYSEVRGVRGEKLVYAGLGYAYHWKFVCVQGWVGKQILTSNYDEVNDVFFFLNL